jgi:hypothetical protein
MLCQLSLAVCGKIPRLFFQTPALFMTLIETSMRQQTNPLAGEIGDFSGSILQ